MRSVTTRSFREAFGLLPRHVQHQAREAYRLFAADPGHPGLRLKKVRDAPVVVSARISRGYRALGIRSAGTVVWFWIGSHTDYERQLR